IAGHQGHLVSNAGLLTNVLERISALMVIAGHQGRLVSNAGLLMNVLERISVSKGDVSDVISQFCALIITSDYLSNLGIACKYLKSVTLLPRHCINHHFQS
ncbi:MAG: hypothetical protein OQL11_13880, partial [Gammaproteobacteria bacterium]|nr:hypothetical protein [Gammaproteobacteria bacterium]